MQKRLPEPVIIYGLFLPSGLCVYIGATTDPVERKYAHQARFQRENMPMSLFFLQAISIAWSEGHAQWEEEKWLKYYKSIGQAALNNREWSGFTYRHQKPTWQVVETGEFFRDVKQLMQWSGTPRSQLHEAAATGKKANAYSLNEARITVRAL